MEENMKSMTSIFCHDILTSERTGDNGSPCILAEEEKRVLTQSLPSGNFIVFESGLFGPHLVTDKKHWFSEADEFYQEFVLNAFSLLCKRGYIQHTKPHLFKLSREGFEAAYGLLDESQQGACEVDAA